MCGNVRSLGRVTGLVLAILSLTVGVLSAAADLASGWQQFESGNIDGAYDTFSTLFKASPADPAVNFALGRAAFERGKLSHALLAFERVLMATPSNPRARLELARTYYQMGQVEVSRKHFEMVLQSDPPPTVRKNVEYFLKQIERDTQRWRFGATIESSIFYDDNVNYGPASGQIDTTLGELTVNDESLPKSEYGGSIGGGGDVSYDLGDKDGWLSTLGLVVNQTWLESSHGQETRYAQASAGVRLLKPWHVLDLDLRVAHLDYGHDPYLDIYGTDLVYMRMVGRRCRVTSSASVEYRDFELNDRDAGYYALSQSVSWTLGRAGHSVAATVRGFYDDAQSSAYRNRGGDAILSGTLRLPMRSDVYSQLQYRRNVYEDVTYPLLQSAARKDHQYQVTVGVRHSPLPNMSLDVFHQYVNNQSSFGLYDYTRNFTGCKAAVGF